MHNLLRPNTALNLELKGSTGSFQVGTGANENSSLEVKYFLTHVSLDFTSSSNSQLLSQLAPVREIFDQQTLEFDEILQRDIDDSRVSSKLVPYLLDERNRDLVKIFPPIVVVVLPIQPSSSRAENLYPRVESTTVTEEGTPYIITRSGAVGREVFEFRQPEISGEVYEHDFNRLKLNTNLCRLVIVDGQHRAMALLALYRNLRDGWSDARRLPYKDYYEEWTAEYINTFNLSRISLPVMLCTFPQLDENYTGDCNVKAAARSIFLTLNKTAKPVSQSRNRLLDDNDLVALFLRDTLSQIKQKNVRSPHALRIWNVELDQMHDKVKIDNPIALTGVNHLYYITEHYLLNKIDGDIRGVNPRSGSFSKRKDLSAYGASTRLSMLDLLGSEDTAKTQRYFYTKDVGEKLTTQFRSRAGNFFISALEQFTPFANHSTAVLDLDKSLLAMANQKVRNILFDGQGISEVFEDHRRNLAEKVKEGKFGANPAEIQAILDKLNATAQLVKTATQELRQKRADNFLESVADKSKIRQEDGTYPPKLVEFISYLFDNVFTSVAFQTALICGFFAEIESLNTRLQGESKPLVDTSSAFSEYIAKLNEFFAPKTASQVKRLIETFHGRVEGEVSDWQIAPSSFTFKDVVSRGEMQPDYWPKYKYLLLELWRPASDPLRAALEARRGDCRRQVFDSLIVVYRNDMLQTLSKREENLTPDEHDTINKKAYDALRGFLKNIGVLMSDVPSMSAFLSAPPTPEAVDEQTDET